MKTVMFFERIAQYVANKKNVTNVIFYLVVLGFFWFYYGFKVMTLTILFVVSIVILSEVLMEAYLYVYKRQRKLEKSLLKSVISFIIVWPFSILFLNFKVLVYVTLLSLFVMCIGVYYHKK